MSAPSTPETVKELIQRLQQFPPDWEISFSPFTLYRLKDRGGFVHFEFNEAEGVHYTLHTAQQEGDSA